MKTPILNIAVCIALLAGGTIAAVQAQNKAEQPRRHEAQYVDAWCNAAGGESEYRLPDRTRVDCLLDDFAIEFDWGAKWAECIGQAAFYAEMTDRKAACVLILHRRDRLRAFYRFANRARLAAARANVLVVCIDTGGKEMGCSRTRAKQLIK